MWVADTDFKAPQAITQALQKRLDHGVYGYTSPPEKLNSVMVTRMQSLYNWDIQPEWIVWLPGLVCALHLACRAAAPNGGRALVPNPIYFHFDNASDLSNLDTCNIPMTLKGERWVIDMDLLENSVTDETKILMLCNPHNPAGTMFNRAELEQLAAFAIRHNLVLCSDDIHCDLILDETLQHIPIASLNNAICQQTITLMAPSKTFNIAGLGCAFAIISDSDLRKRFNRVRDGIVPHTNLLGFSATYAAYTQCDDWLEAKLDYLRENHRYLLQEINQIPGLKMLPHEATYLAWIDISQANIDQPQRFFEKAGVGISPGADFGDKQFVRLNFGCTKETLVEAVSRIKKAMLVHSPNSTA